MLRPPRLTCLTTDLSGDRSLPRPAWQVGPRRPSLSNMLGELGPVISFSPVVGAHHSSPNARLTACGRDGRDPAGRSRNPEGCSPCSFFGCHHALHPTGCCGQDVVVVGTEEGGERGGPPPSSAPTPERSHGAAVAFTSHRSFWAALVLWPGDAGRACSGGCGLCRRGSPVGLVRASLHGAHAQTRAHPLVVPVPLFRIPLKKKNLLRKQKIAKVFENSSVFLASCKKVFSVVANSKRGEKTNHSPWAWIQTA